MRSLVLGFLLAVAGKAALSGTVVSLVGPIRGASATLFDDATKSEVARSRAAADGRFEFPAVAAGSYSLRIEAVGFAIRTVQNIVLREGEDRSIPPVTLSLPVCGTPSLDHQRLLDGTQAAVLSGRVQDRKGRPVRDAKITVECADATCPTAFSDSTGSYTLRDLHPGDNYWLNVTAKGYFAERSGTYLAQSGYELFYWPIRLERCRFGNCDPRWKPKRIALCE